MYNSIQPELQAKLAMLENIPEELKCLNQWVVWQYEDIGSAKPTKVPYSPTAGIHANVNDFTTWSSFEKAIEVYASGRFDGIGFVLSNNDPYTFIDLDDTKGDKVALERQQKIFKEFDSYNEISPSGVGLHIIVKGDIPVGRRRSSIEIYSNQRYATFTGNVYQAKPIKERQVFLMQLWEQMGASIPQTMLFTGDKVEKQTDQEILDIAFKATNGDKASSLYSGQWQGLYSSQSEADFAFIDIIAYYTQNRNQIERIFKASGLGKRDKAKRKDYLAYMINRSFDRMLPPIDMDGFKIEVEKVLNSPVAQRLELATHNGSVVGSNPTGTTTFEGSEGASPNGKAPDFDSVYVGSIPTAPTIPKKFSVTLPPGLMGEIAQFIYAASPRPVPEIALAGAIGLMAGIAGRSYNVSSTGLNQYVLLLARTGRGKEAMASGIHKLLNIVKQQVPTVMEFMGPDEIASGQALYKYLATSKCFVSILSEFGLRLMQMADADGGSPATSLRRMLLQLYAKSGFTDSAQPSIYSDKDRNIATIQSPSFSILGESTPHTFYRNLNEDMITEGLLPRFLLIEYDGPRTPENTEHASAVPSFSLIDKLRDVAANSMTVQNASPRRVINVQFTPDAKQIANSYSSYCDNIINNPNSNIIIVELWNRAHLKVLKLAALVSIGVNPYDPIIEPAHINWAIEMVNADIETLSKKFEEGLVGSNTEESKQINEFIRVIKEYIISDFEHVQKYCKTDKNSDKLHADRIITYGYISRRLMQMAAFRTDKIGSTNALKRTIQQMIDRDYMREVPRQDMTAKYGTTQKAFVISNNNLLR